MKLVTELMSHPVVKNAYYFQVCEGSFTGTGTGLTSDTPLQVDFGNFIGW